MFHQFVVDLAADASGNGSITTQRVKGEIARMVFLSGDMGALTNLTITGLDSGVPVASGVPGAGDSDITPESEGRTATDLSTGAGTATKNRVALAEALSISFASAATNSNGQLVFVIRTDSPTGLE